MPLTRDQFNDVRNAADAMIKEICQNQEFVKTLVDSVSSGIINILGEKLGILEKKIDALNKDMSDMKMNHAKEIKTLNDKIESLERNLSNISGDLPDAAHIVEEFDEIKRRENNVIIFGVPEEVDDPTSIVCDIVSAIVPDLAITNQRMHRLGKRLRGKSRPIKVSLSNNADKLTLIRGNKRLQRIERFKNVYIRPDQTIKQRNYLSLLRQQLMERQQNGEDDIIIRFRNGHPSITKKKNL